MSTLTYKCPCCGASLAYDGMTRRLQCASCGNSFELEDIEALEATGSQSSIDFVQPDEQFTDEEIEAISSYVCQNCGAELMTDSTTTATECAYCGSPAILPQEIDAGVRPQKVVPFRITKEQAVEIFQKFFTGKRLMPNVFLNSKNRIAEMRKLYVPYWLFDCEAYADMTFNAEKKHYMRQGDWEIIRTDHYLVRRAGTLCFEDLPVDGSRKMDDSITESLEPYDVGDAVPFEPAVLAGALADRADVDAQECEDRAAERMKVTIESEISSTVGGYTSVSRRSSSVNARGGRVTPVLMPIWLITTEKQFKGEKRIFTFAINGQTGRLTCDVPYDKGKAAAWFLAVFAGCFGSGYLLLQWLLGSGVF